MAGSKPIPATSPVKIMNERRSAGAKPLVIACNTISAELELAMKEAECTFPIRWIDSGLHIKPAELRSCLQAELDDVMDTDTVLLAFGFCGNALVGLKPAGFRLVLPKVDDCITLLLGSRKNRADIPESTATYYLTRGWLDNERNIWGEYQECLKRHGQKRTDIIYKTLLAHYTQLGLIETGAYDFREFFDRTAVIGETLGLRRLPISGTLRLMKKLLTGPWDDEFIIVPPGETITEKLLYFSEAAPAVSGPQIIGSGM